MLADVDLAATPTTIVGAFIFVALSLVALIGWILKHLFITTIPGILSDQKAQRECYEEQQAQQREAHEKALNAIVSSFRAETSDERRLCAEQFTLVNTTLAGLTSAVNQEGGRIIAAINAHTTEQMGAYRHQ